MVEIAYPLGVGGLLASLSYYMGSEANFALQYLLRHVYLYMFIREGGMFSDALGVM